ncbi:MAG: T9SS type A sorting domain-containing protein [Candidatus Cloacimonetes bacterium]|nr:T9SS type A sorting domain-containing protein [Candidatus Cloacimonadota bacterium]MCF7813281.1 T9SS type A sorting domain-containing protein [Candidatus Cloacimonadota bacterium]MCF7867356.1 T9SS type A sorting domain-containing protein [Candidatus Cloacimonadota bacterium]MCF7882790.1 T9SS type A sorting domain-containing protein [Candidatus Cloacimonadota bacterium]
MKKVFVILILTVVSFLVAIEFRPAGGMEVNPGMRDSLVYYHQNTVDQLWYGASSWAVRFDFETYLGAIPGQQFAAEGALIYLPGSQSSDPLSVKVARDSLYQPDAVYDSIMVQPNQLNLGAWNNIEFNDTIIDSKMWLIVDYPTNSTDQFIAASEGDGLTSYFYTNDYYYSMNSFNYQSEFLFCLYGHFITDGTDLDVLDFTFEGDITSAAQIFPKLTIRNASNSTAQDAYLVFSMSSPENEIFVQELTTGLVRDTIFVDNISAGSIVTYDFTDSLYFGLLHSASQYEASAYIGCASDSLNQNNSLDLEFDTFYHSMPVTIVENCVQLNSNNSTNVMTVQQDVIDPETTEVINYFPSAGNVPFYCIDSFNRYNSYSFVGLPGTVLNGSRQIPGYISSSYITDFTDLYDDAMNDSTFVSSFNVSGKYDNAGFAEIKVEAANSETRVFTNFLDDCSIYTMIVEDVIDNASLPSGFTIPILRYIPTQFENITLAADTSFVDSVDFDYNLDFTTINGDMTNCRAVAILQNDETKQIYAYNAIDFDDFQLVDIQENEIDPIAVNMRIFPNPYLFNGNLHINFNMSENAEDVELKIYNIRGQLVRKMAQDISNTNNSFIWNGKDENSKQVSSGVYLLKLSARSGNEKIVKHKKCLLLKK